MWDYCISGSFTFSLLPLITFSFSFILAKPNESVSSCYFLYSLFYTLMLILKMMLMMIRRHNLSLCFISQRTLFIRYMISLLQRRCGNRLRRFMEPKTKTLRLPRRSSSMTWICNRLTLSIMTKLAFIDCKIDEDDIVVVLLKSMPREYDELIATLKN